MIVSLFVGSLAAEAHREAVTVSLGSPSFSIPFGTVAPGDVLEITITGLPGGLSSASATPSEGPGAWTGGLTAECGTAVFTATIPSDYSGAHSGNFSGGFCLSGEGDGPPPTWSGDSAATVCETTIDQSGELEVLQAQGASDLTLTASTTSPPLKWKIDDQLEHVRHLVNGDSVEISYKPGQGMQDSAADEIGVLAHASGNEECQDGRVVTVTNTWRPGDIGRDLLQIRAAVVDTGSGGEPNPGGLPTQADEISRLSYGPESGDQLEARFTLVGRAAGDGFVYCQVYPDSRMGGRSVKGRAHAAAGLVLHVEGAENKVAKAVAVGQTEDQDLGTFSSALTPGGIGVTATANITVRNYSGDMQLNLTSIAAPIRAEGSHAPGEELIEDARFFIATDTDASVGIQGWAVQAFAAATIQFDADSDKVVWSPVY
ncbi:MAG: hypothetical protein PF961_18055 [Planctomycetota bacterium]|nr:hypothetical protein [Planctomycetota bacterium]